MSESFKALLDETLTDENPQEGLVLIRQFEREKGKLPLHYRITLCKLLYLNKRYNEVLQTIRDIQADGRNSPDIEFIRGLCLYQLHDYTEAENIFKTDKRWEIWKRRAQIMKNAKKDPESIIYIPERIIPVPIPADIKAECSQDSSFMITVILPILDVQFDQISTNIFPNAIDLDIIFVPGDATKYSYSLEFTKEINTDTVKITATFDEIIITVMPKIPEKWETILFQAPDSENVDKIIPCLESMISKMPDTDSDSKTSAFKFEWSVLESLEIHPGNSE